MFVLRLLSTCVDIFWGSPSTFPIVYRRPFEKSLVGYSGNALKNFTDEHGDKIELHKFLQYIFFEQWKDLKNYCVSNGISIIGDIPIYAGFESADVWTHGRVFKLSGEMIPEQVAGVPPDYFSATGQRWGNPLYSWFDVNGSLKDETMKWWLKRIMHLSEMVDYIRIDHFRAFESYWAIDAAEETAVRGEWKKGPGKALRSYLWC